jgi:hypothetical protein
MLPNLLRNDPICLVSTPFQPNIPHLDGVLTGIDPGPVSGYSERR